VGAKPLATPREGIPDRLKIDRSFVAEALESLSGSMLASSIIGVAQSLNLKTVAEGVETREQLEFLLERRCHVMQGFLFSPPVPAGQFTGILEAGFIDPGPEKPSD
jgi:EAL domain-containing protein (putative c-di-GMP-specific phosphodiesterase class I)